MQIISIIYRNIQNLLCNFVAFCPHNIHTELNRIQIQSEFI